MDVKFNDPIAAFKSKTTFELIRGYVVYVLCSSSFLVDNNMKVSVWRRRRELSMLESLVLRAMLDSREKLSIFTSENNCWVRRIFYGIYHIIDESQTRELCIHQKFNCKEEEVLAIVQPILVQVELVWWSSVVIILCPHNSFFHNLSLCVMISVIHQAQREQLNFSRDMKSKFSLGT